jgi:hypothetical protein
VEHRRESSLLVRCAVQTLQLQLILCPHTNKFPSHCNLLSSPSCK